MVQANRQGAIEKLNAIIEKGRGRTMTALTEIEAEWQSRRDIIVPAKRMQFEVDDTGIHPVALMEKENRRFDLTPHSHVQVLERSGIPKQFADKLQKLGEVDLLQHNLMTLFRRVSSGGVLVRHVDNRIKGFLSTAYKPMDASPIFEGLATEALGRGFVPYRGLNTDTRMSATFLWPNVYEPKTGEFVVYGISQTTGDYGGVANTLELMALRIWCDNLMLGFDMMRKIHIGKRFNGEENVIELSRKTHELDTATVVSATKDAVKSAIGYFEPLNGAITAAADREPDVAATLKTLGKKGLKKEVLEQVEKTYAMEMPIEALPQGKSAWRLSNVLSLIAKSHEGDAKVDLESAAFDVLGIDKLQTAA